MKLSLLAPVPVNKNLLSFKALPTPACHSSLGLPSMFGWAYHFEVVEAALNAARKFTIASAIADETDCL